MTKAYGVTSSGPWVTVYITSGVLVATARSLGGSQGSSRVKSNVSVFRVTPSVAVTPSTVAVIVTV